MFVYSIEIFNEKKNNWVKENRFYLLRKSGKEFDVFPIEGKRKNFKLVASW